MTEIDTAQPNSRPPSGPADSYDPVPAVIDWMIGLLVGVVGLALTTVGIGLYTRVDQSVIAEVVADESVEVNGLTEAEFVTAAAPFVDWLGIGMAVTGLLAVIGATGFVVARRRTRHRVAREGGSTATVLGCAVYGAAVTALVSFVPGSAVAGGSAAAYLCDSDSGVRVGAAAGAIGAVVAIPLLAFLAVGFVNGASAIGELAGGWLLAGVVVTAGLLGVVLNTALGALGGFLVDRFF